MGVALLLDRVIGAKKPSLATAQDLADFESVPYRERIAALSTYQALQIGAAANPAAPAIVFLPNADPLEAGQVISYAQFLGDVTRAANLFHSLGVGPGDVVSSLLPLIPQSFAVLFGAQAAGIANPVNSLLEPHQIAEILQAANTKVLVTTGPNPAAPPGTDTWEKVDKLRALLPDLKAIVVVGSSAAVPGTFSYDAMLPTFPGDKLLSGRQINAGDIAAYFHTGGTTGTPKLVRHTHENQVYQAWVCNLMLSGSPGRSLLFGLPLFHVGGALTQGLASFAGGACNVVLSAAGWRNPAAVRNVWKLVERFKPDVFGGVPTVLAASIAVPTGDADTSSIRVASGGGSAIPVAVANTIQERLGVPVLEVYGMTETSSVHTISYLDRPVRLGTVGHAVPYSKVRIVKIDANGNYAGDCAVNEIGVVAMAGPGVFSGYLNDQHNRGAFVEPGWVNSGDLGRLDAEGYLWITGRAKDLIIRGGHNIDPMPIEELFYQHPDVALAAMVGQPDAYAGELPLAYVQLKPGAQTSAAQLHEMIRSKTPERAAVPVQVVLVDAIPLTGVGKVFKPQLRWDATQRVFFDTLQPARDQVAGLHGSLSVQVGADGTHGTLATVTIKGVTETAKAALEAQVHQLLNPFVTRHLVIFS